MSKQVKLKFKKLLKKAEFVHADLEYHEELLPEAKNLFSQEVAQAIKDLTPEQQKHVAEIDRQRQIAQEEKIKEAAKAAQDAADLDDDEGTPLNDETALTESEHDYIEEERESEEPEEAKASQLKKLYRQVAALTHPDKAKAAGASDKEASRLGQLFMQAKKAYDDKNWYILYSIALALDIDVPEPSPENLEWIEEDIRYTMGTIAQIGNLIAWMWYSGDAAMKQIALSNFFEQMYGLSLVAVQLDSSSNVY
jgi:flagellar biosynthesis GTPase FlhF